MSCGNAYCRFAQRCREKDTGVVKDETRCMEAVHWEDMEWDAECAANYEAELPFCDPWPEEGEADGEELP